MRRDMAGALSVACLALALALSSCAAPKEPPIQEGAPVPDTAGRVVNLAQNWSAQQQQWFWFTSQGSRLLPYDWYLALEQAGSTELFRSDAHMDDLRFLLEKPSPANPDGLPVGLAKDTDSKTGQAWVGLTCSACHTGQVNYKGTMMRIDGAPTLADHFRFSDELVAVLRATASDDAKFERFARKVLGQGYAPESAQKLREELRGTADVLGLRQDNDRPDHPYGYARLDAFGAIFNQVMAVDINVPGNYQKANAPVSFPFIWDSPQLDMVQWNGSTPNGAAGFGPLARNVGEILGVYGTVSVQPVNGLKGYPSSARIATLGELEKSLDDLWSPLWPSEILPAIDTAKAAQGQPLFQQHCAQCHALIDRTSPKRRITTVMTPVDELRTDPTMADNFANRTGKTGPLKGHKVLVVAGQTFGEEATGFQMLEHVAVGTILGQKAEAIEAGLDEYLKIKAARTFDARSYKARSLNGIWATVPYLHNGSVPNLWQLLQPEDKRVKEFYVGSRELDPVNVGLDTAPYPGGYKFDTELLGLLLDEIAAWPLMLVATFRPEFQAPWGHRANVTQLSLSRLTEAQTTALIDRLMQGGDALPAGLRLPLDRRPLPAARKTGRSRRDDRKGPRRRPRRRAPRGAPPRLPERRVAPRDRRPGRCGSRPARSLRDRPPGPADSHRPARALEPRSPPRIARPPRRSRIAARAGDRAAGRCLGTGEKNLPRRGPSLRLTPELRAKRGCRGFSLVSRRSSPVI